MILISLHKYFPNGNNISEKFQTGAKTIANAWNTGAWPSIGIPNIWQLSYLFTRHLKTESLLFSIFVYAKLLTKTVCQEN